MIRHLSHRDTNAVLESAIGGKVNLVVGIPMSMTSRMVMLYSLFFYTKNFPTVHDTGSDTKESNVRFMVLVLRKHKRWRIYFQTMTDRL